jgi:hypothetical protein
MVKKKIRTVKRARKRPTRKALLVERAACEVHEECCAHWNIQPEKDVCIHELNGTIDECPDRVEEENGYAYQGAATGSA